MLAYTQMDVPNKFYVYYIECETHNHCYVGHTKDYARRLTEHMGIGAVRRPWFTKKHGVKASHILCIVQTRGEAQRVEYAYQRSLSRKHYIVGGSFGNGQPYTPTPVTTTELDCARSAIQSIPFSKRYK